jgi:hypothetical protein
LNPHNAMRKRWQGTMATGAKRRQSPQPSRPDQRAPVPDPGPDPRAWWMLVHQLPPEPPGLRMRIWRRLQDLGALQLKGSVYLLPATEAAREDLQWIVAEVRAAGAEASLWCAASIEGMADEELLRRFRQAAAEQYEQIDAEARALLQATRDPPAAAARPALLRLRARLADAVRRDHFEAAGRERAEAALARLAASLDPGATTHSSPPVRLARETYRGRTWITRARVGVDRMASAWLIRRMIDPQARFEFSPGARIAAAAGRLRFDTWGGEFTHEGDCCTFEVLVARFGLDVPGLSRLAGIVHDIDLKEARHGHAETAGIAAALEAIGAAPLDDHQRIELAATLFDGLLRQFAAAAGGNRR